jgi:hypothetical protein
MRKNPTRFLAAVVSTAGTAALIFVTAAHGQTYNSRCGWNDGVYACTSKVETPHSVTTTLCASGGIDAACTSKTEEKKRPSESHVLDVRDDARKAAVPKAEDYRDHGSHDLCPPPYRMTERDGCQRR